jgi:hypothetical protein
MTIEKENFLRTRLITYLQRLDPLTPPRWGNMSVQHMIEHLGTDGFCIASGRIRYENIVTAPERLDRYMEFLMSDKPFKENTMNPLLASEPMELKYKTVQAAIGALQEELIFFFEAFKKNPALITRNPIFGDLNFEQNVQLLHKHAMHHLHQFGIDAQ